MKKNKLITAILILVCCSVFATGCTITFDTNGNSKRNNNHRNSRHERSIDDDEDEDDDDDRRSRRNSRNRDDEDIEDIYEYEYDVEEYGYYVDHENVADDINFPADMDMETRSCMTTALDDLEWSPSSRAQMMEYLTESYIGFTTQQATEALDAMEEMNLVDWKEQAYLQAVSFINTGATSRQGLISLLSSEFGCMYTQAEADYAVNKVESEGGVDWYAEAVESALEYLDFDTFTRDSMIYQLTSQFEGFTQEEAEYACDYVGLN